MIIAKQKIRAEFIIEFGTSQNFVNASSRPRQTKVTGSRSVFRRAAAFARRESGIRSETYRAYGLLSTLLTVTMFWQSVPDSISAMLESIVAAIFSIASRVKMPGVR